jgi:aspartyl-tRNA(Asn)/glutamyl-tRNA(Gln) amidotransferase subunit A
MIHESDLKKLTLSAAAKLIRQKQISPVELTESILRRVDSLNDRMRPFITVTAEPALAMARAAEHDVVQGKASGILHGVPISLKDLYDTKGIRTTAGSKVFESRVPTEDCTIAQKLYSAGAVLIGKTNLHEFAYGTTNVNSHFGTARNPWNPEYITGGSSGGSASAVALSLGFGSMGSDTGGSIRIPASLCGVVGLKPTYGRSSLRGIIPLSWSLDHPGPLGQTVEDIALLFGVTAGHDPGDPYSADKPPSSLKTLDGKIKGLRVGIPRSYFFDNLDPQVQSAIDAALKTFQQLGASLRDVELKMAPLQRGIWGQIACPEAYSFHEQLLKDRGQDYGADVRSRLQVGRLLLSADYVRAQRARTLMREEARRVFETVDVLVTPTVPITPPRIGQGSAQRGSVSEPVGVSLTRCTRHFNVTGQPAISLPCGFTTDGLPIGLQIAGRPFEESTILQAAYAYEQDARWFERRCTL